MGKLLESLVVNSIWKWCDSRVNLVLVNSQITAKLKIYFFQFSSSLAFTAASCTFSFVSFQTGRLLWATLHLCTRACQQVTLKDKRNCVPNYNFSRYASIWDIPIFTTGGKPLIEIYWQLEVWALGALRNCNLLRCLTSMMWKWFRWQLESRMIKPFRLLQNSESGMIEPFRLLQNSDFRLLTCTSGTFNMFAKFFKRLMQASLMPIFLIWFFFKHNSRYD